MTNPTSIDGPTSGSGPRRLVTALLIAGVALAVWQSWPSTQGRIGLRPSLVSLDEASDFTGTDISSSSALSAHYSYADYVGRDGEAHLIIELVYDDYGLPTALPAPSEGRHATTLVDGHGDAAPVPGASSAEALLDFTTSCLRIRVSGTGFSPSSERTAQFRDLLIQRAATAAQGKAPSC